MARGNIAKDNVVKKLQEVFGTDYIGEYAKKYYVWAQENGERVQIAISLTCPKVPVEIVNTPSFGDYNFEDDSSTIATMPVANVEITEEERARVNDLMRALNL